MILSQNEITELSRKGEKLVGSNGKPIALKTPTSKDSPELSYLRVIAGLLEQLLKKPQPELPRMETPTQQQPVIVRPEVIVNTPQPEILPAPQPIRKWKFDLERDVSGHTTQIIATALE